MTTLTSLYFQVAAMLASGAVHVNDDDGGGNSPSGGGGGPVVMTSSRRSSQTSTNLLAARPVLDRRSSHCGALMRDGALAGSRPR